MLIIIKSLIILFITYFCGYGIVGFFQLPNYEAKKFQKFFLIIPVVGYSISQFLFWLFYSGFQNHLVSFCFTFLAIILINFCFLLIVYRKNKNFYKEANWIIPSKADIYIFLVLIVIFLISSWQYVIIGAGQYYHSANPDFFDGITGGLGYYKDVPLKLMEEDFSINFPLQYSSLTFWHIILRNDWVDGFVLQAILNLYLTAIGIFWLTKYVFNTKNKVALWTSFWATVGNFYLATFFNGHIGSLIYISIVPVFLGIIILWSRKELKIQWIILATCLLAAIQLTYPGPVYFILIPAIFLILTDRVLLPFKLDERFFNFLGISNKFFFNRNLKKIKWFRIILIVLISAVIIFLSMWLLYIYFEPRRVSALLRTFVSWRITLYKEMFMIFWGIYPSGSSGSFSLIPFFASNEIINNITFFIAIIITFITIWAALKCLTMKSRHFLFIYSLFYLPFFIMMRYFWGSPYFFYKFLYTNFFLIIIIIVPWIFERQNPFRRFKSLLLTSLFILIGCLNIVWNLSIGFDFTQRIYHQKREVDEFVALMSNQQYKETYFDTPIRLYTKVFKYIFDKNNIRLKDDIDSAKYLIQLQDINQATYNTLNPDKIIFSNNLFKLIVPNNQNKITVETQYPPEFNGEININWVGNQLNLQKRLLENYVLEVIKFIKETGIDGQIFLDIFTSELNDYSYLIINDILSQNGINIQKNVNKATYFLRMCGDQDIYKPLFGKNENEKTVWQNDFIKIVYLPKEKRIVGNISPNYDYTPLFSKIKKSGEKVYLDIQQDDDMLLAPLKQKMLADGIKITENPDSTTLICRYNFYPPLTNYNNYTLAHPFQGTIYRTNNKSFNSYPWEIELMNMPLRGRKTITRDFRFNSRERFLSGKRREDFKCIITNLSADARFIRLLIAPGPSIDFSEFNLEIVSNSAKIKKVYRIVSPITKIDLDLKDIKNPDSLNVSFTLTGVDLQGNNLTGHSLLPLDDRYLLYDVMAVELTDNVENYSKNLLKVFNCQPTDRINLILKKIFKLQRSPDIINPTDSNKVLLGLDWYPYEIYRGESFRWVGKDTSEIILNSINKRNHSLLLNLEPGPGCGTEPLKLEILYRNKILQSGIISGRKNFEIQIPKEMYNNYPSQKIFKIVSNGNLKVPSDPRVLSYRVFNISLAKVGSKKGDIINENYLNQIEIGKGWYSIEKYKGESFRWVGKDTSEIILYDVDKKHQSLLLGLEPGPGCGNEPLKLLILYKNKIIQKGIISGRKNLEIQLPKEASTDFQSEMVLKLLTENGNYEIASDPRILNYRVFDVSLKQRELKKNDIVEINNIDQIQMGKGWGVYETYNNESFRWVGKESAEIIMNNLDSTNKKIKFNIEPGPGCAGQPLRVKIFLNNKLIDKQRFIGRNDMIVDLQKHIKNLRGKFINLRFEPISKNAKTKSDKRILNFRVFNITLIN